MVTEVTERALAHTEKKEVLLTGGVAANKRLQSMLGVIAEEHDARFSVVPLEFATDNGAMIAWTGTLAFRYGLVTPLEESFVKLRWRVDKVDVPWVEISHKALMKKGAEASLFLADWHGTKSSHKGTSAQKVPPSQRWMSRFAATAPCTSPS